MTISIDRATGERQGSTIFQSLGITLMRLAYRVLTPFGHLGISRVNRLVGRVLMGSGDTLFHLDQDTAFSTPSADYYWSRLYSESYEYEPEVARVFRSFADLDYMLIDLGANYGYWSLLVSSPGFGAKSVVSVEASGESFNRLCANAAQRGDLITPHHLAIWNKSGESLEFFGSRHAGRSLLGSRSSGQQATERVTSITVTDLVSDHIDSGEDKKTRFVVKMDVEGVEAEATEGATDVLDRIDGIIFEDSNNAKFGENFLKIREITGFDIYFLDEDAFRKVESPYDIYDPRESGRALQSIGFNFLALRPNSVFAAALGNFDKSSTGA